jgi:hypothetical protein
VLWSHTLQNLTWTELFYKESGGGDKCFLLFSIQDDFISLINPPPNNPVILGSMFLLIFTFVILLQPVDHLKPQIHQKNILKIHFLSDKLYCTYITKTNQWILYRNIISWYMSWIFGATECNEIILGWHLYQVI